MGTRAFLPEADCSQRGHERLCTYVLVVMVSRTWATGMCRWTMRANRAPGIYPRATASSGSMDGMYMAVPMTDRATAASMHINDGQWGACSMFDGDSGATSIMREARRETYKYQITPKIFHHRSELN